MARLTWIDRLSLETAVRTKRARQLGFELGRTTFKVGGQCPTAGRGGPDPLRKFPLFPSGVLVYLPNVFLAAHFDLLA
jgi:hypothetical protein